MYATVKTMYNTQIELARALTQLYVPLTDSTLNQKFNVGDNAPALNAGEYPTLGYFAIGNGAHSGRVTGTGTVIDISQHNVVHAALYNHIPFIIREVNNDLTNVERAKYGLRVQETYNGADYFVYYLKKLDLASATAIGVEEVTVSNGAITSASYQTTPAQLDPVVIPVSNTSANASTGKHIKVSSELEILLDSNDIQEIVNAIDIITGDIAFAVISEVATVTAVPGTINHPFDNVGYTEALYAQVANFIPTNVDLKFTTTEVKLVSSIGHTSPYVT